jgi:hypothetical protein
MIEIKRKDGEVIKTIDADSLREANLRGADLREADMRGADMQGADIRGADMQGADMRGADMRGADMRWADMRGADMQGADMRGADMSWADIRGADMQGADLRQCKQYFVVIRASRHDIVAIDDDIRIGCQHMTLAMWLEQFEAVGREAGYTLGQITEYGIYLKAIRDVLEMRKNAATNE